MPIPIFNAIPRYQAIPKVRNDYAIPAYGNFFCHDLVHLS